jgi:hypothetical protein
MHARIRRIRNRWRTRRLLRLQRFAKDESGLQLVELTIVIPIFLLLFAATAEFGRYFYEYTTLAKAARAGARYLSTAPTGDEDANAQKMVVYGNTSGTGSPILTGLEMSHVKIRREGGVIASIPETVTIYIEGYKHQPIFDLGKLLNVKGLSMNVDVKPSVTMRYLLTQPPPI